jgi:hypothetical protein
MMFWKRKKEPECPFKVGQTVWVVAVATGQIVKATVKGFSQHHVAFDLNDKLKASALQYVFTDEVSALTDLERRLVNLEQDWREHFNTASNELRKTQRALKRVRQELSVAVGHPAKNEDKKKKQ